MTKANQTFFIPQGIRRLRLSELPLSDELARVQRRLCISTFDDLAGASLRDFSRVSATGTASFLEIRLLIQRARQGEFAAPPLQRVKHSPERLVTTDRRAQNQPIDDNAVSELPPDEAIFVPLEARGKLLAAFPVSVRLAHIFEFKHFRLFGDLHGRTFSEFRDYRNCGKKTLDELRKCRESPSL